MEKRKRKGIIYNIRQDSGFHSCLDSCPNSCLMTGLETAVMIATLLIIHSFLLWHVWGKDATNAMLKQMKRDRTIRRNKKRIDAILKTGVGEKTFPYVVKNVAEEYLILLYFEEAPTLQMYMTVNGKKMDAISCKSGETYYFLLE